MPKHLMSMLAAALVVAGGTTVSCRAADSADVAKRFNAYLEDGKIAVGATTLSKELQSSPGDDTLRFAAGTAQFIAAVERMGQSWHRFGLSTDRGAMRNLPFVRLPVPPNPNPEKVSSAQARDVLEQFLKDIGAAEATLADIKSDTVKLPLYIGQARLDFVNDGKASNQEALWRIYMRLNPRQQITEEQAKEFHVKLDAGDVRWLRGYCHLLSAFLEFWLAHDDSRLFNHTAQLVFAKPDIPYDFLLVHKNAQEWFADIPDVIAFIHLLNLPVKEPARTGKALEHLTQVIMLSREAWKLYMAETDDDHEWIPNPKQTGVVPGVKVTDEMVQQWLVFLDEFDALLTGKKLIPFWRGDKPLGVNLKRVFTEPTNLDVVLWVQGTAAAPYLEEGELTKPEFWRRLNSSFGGQFAGFALWFN